MYKQVWTIVRGTLRDSAEEFTDRNALLILKQQIRDSADAITTARKAVALAMAQDEQERAQHKKLVERITELEARAVAAIEQGKEELAREAAEVIAGLEEERDTSLKAQTYFAAEIARLRTNLRNAEARLRDLQRGQRIAAATDAAQKLRNQSPEETFASLVDAEVTLERLRRRQTEADLTAKAMSELDGTDNPERIREKLAEAGCGEPLRPNADLVLERLRKRAGSKATDGGDAKD